jgi:hypothetical protein
VRQKHAPKNSKPKKKFFLLNSKQIIYLESAHREDEFKKRVRKSTKDKQNKISILFSPSFRLKKLLWTVAP